MPLATSRSTRIPSSQLGALRRQRSAGDLCRDGALRDFVEAGLEVFATIVSLPPTGVLTVMVGALRRTQIAVLDQVTGPIDADRRELVDRHAAAVVRLVHAILARDREAALRAGLDRELMVIFAAAPTPN